MLRMKVLSARNIQHACTSVKRENLPGTTLFHLKPDSDSYFVGLPASSTRGLSDFPEPVSNECSSSPTVAGRRESEASGCVEGWWYGRCGSDEEASAHCRLLPEPFPSDSAWRVDSRGRRRRREAGMVGNMGNPAKSIECYGRRDRAMLDPRIAFNDRLTENGYAVGAKRCMH